MTRTNEKLPLLHGEDGEVGVMHHAFSLNLFFLEKMVKFEPSKLPRSAQNI
jgi:hypothetical protein